MGHWGGDVRASQPGEGCGWVQQTLSRALQFPSALFTDVGHPSLYLNSIFSLQTCCWFILVHSDSQWEKKEKLVHQETGKFPWGRGEAGGCRSLAWRPQGKCCCRCLPLTRCVICVLRSDFDYLSALELCQNRCLIHNGLLICCSLALLYLYEIKKKKKFFSLVWWISSSSGNFGNQRLLRFPVL